NEFIAPRNDIETKISEIWQELLGIVPIGAYDNFFELGGHSLLASQIVSRLRKVFNVDLSVSVLLQTQTIARLAEQVEAILCGNNGWQEPVTIITQRNTNESKLLDEQNGTYPLTFAQQRIWILNQLAPNDPSYIIPITLHLSGSLNTSALEQSINEIVRRHQILSTNFITIDGVPVQKINPVSRLTLAVDDLQYLPECERQTEALYRARESALKLFNLEKDQLIRTQLFRLKVDEYLMMLSMHHIVSDGWSLGIFFKEMIALYDAFSTDRSSPLPELSIQYSNFSHWQHNFLSDTTLTKQLSYWHEKLADAPRQIPLPTDRPRPPRPSFSGSRYRLPMTGKLVEALTRLGYKQGTTLFAVMLTALKVLLFRWTGEKDIVIGTVSAGRNRLELEALIGCFINFLPLRSHLSESQSAIELLDQVNKTLLEAYAHEDCPFDKIVELFGAEHRASHHPLYNVGFLMQNFLLPTRFTDHLSIDFIPIESEASLLDLRFIVLPPDKTGTRSLECEYNTDLFDTNTIEKLMHSYLRILTEIVEDPEKRLRQFELIDLVCVANRPKTYYRLIIAATFTCEPMEQSLTFWQQQLEWEFKIEFAPYNQVFQQLLDPNSLIGKNKSGINVLLIRFEDWKRFSKYPDTENDWESITRNTSEFIAAIKVAAVRTPAPLLVFCCPVSEDALANQKTFYAQLEKDFVAELTNIKNIYVIKSNELLTSYPVDNYYDRHSDELGHIPFSLEFFTALGTMLVRKIYALRTTPYKVIVLDCDQTLWQGVCGEDGTFGVQFTPAHQFLQQFVIAQVESGRLVCLCSKNNEEDVWEVFQYRAEMLLKPSHIAAWRINWQPKSENLKELAKELQLGLDSFVFIDDSPLECAEVTIHCPEVLTLQLPTEEDQIPRFLTNIWALDNMNTTSEDHQRTLFYQQSVQREQLRRKSPSLAQFLLELNLEIRISRVQPHQLVRVAQLMQRTNQFNINATRLSESEIEQMLTAGTHQCLIVDVSDRFGDYGLVGAMLFSIADGKLCLDNLLLSCRALGRGVEHHMLALLLEQARKEGLATVEIRFVSTLKNRPALDFLLSIGTQFKEPTVNGYVFRFPSDYPIPDSLSWSTSSEIFDGSEEIFPTMVVKTAAKRERVVHLHKIAEELNSVEQIMAKMVACKRVRPIIETEFVPPGNLLERELANIWRELLGVDQIGVNDNFFQLGGNSLLATQMISRVARLFKAELSLWDVFDSPTVANLAAKIKPLPVSPQNNDEIVVLLRKESGNLHFPLSFGQQRLWFLDQLEPDNPLYNVAGAVRLIGKLDVTALIHSVNAIVKRHEILRTYFTTIDGQACQIIIPAFCIELPLVELGELSPATREIETIRLAQAMAISPFDLSSLPLIRLCLLCLNKQEHMLLTTMHHIISDGWSFGIFVEEMAAFYQAYHNNQDAPLPLLPLQYVDYVQWQRTSMQDEKLAKQLSYWTRQLAGCPATLVLPTDRPRPVLQTYQGAIWQFVLPIRLVEQLQTLCNRTGVTMFMVTLAAFKVLLYRYSQQQEIAIGTPIANRTHSEIEKLIGFFVNTLVLFTELSGTESFAQLLSRLRDVALGAFAHQALPFEKLVEELQPQRDLSRSPLFQVMFVLQNAPIPQIKIAELEIDPFEVDTGTAKFDLTLILTPFVDDLRGTIEYNTDLFDKTTIVRMARHYQTILESIATNEHQPIWLLPMLTTNEREQLLVEWNSMAIEYQTSFVHELIARQAIIQPNATAIVYQDQKISFGELNLQANRLAWRLREMGIRPEVIVGICAERSMEMVVGLLAIIKAGGAYLPLDPDYPIERLNFMLADAGVELVLMQAQLKERLQFTQPVTEVLLDTDDLYWQSTENPTSLLTYDNLAYVIYTSGSTGRPKGVMITHRSLTNNCLNAIERYGLQPTDRVMQFTSISFDVSVEEIFPTLASGATVVLRSSQALDSFADFNRFITEQRITVLALPASYWHEWVSELVRAEDKLATNLRFVIVGNEAVLTERYKIWQQLSGDTIEWQNGYGPTEATVTTTLFRPGREACWSNAIVPIGRPIGNVHVYILDEHQQAVPIGVAGELYIGGAGLARGYLRGADLTAEKFIANPFATQAGARIYRTGDLVRYLTDGNIEFLGRVDQQVKVRGFRIEPAEIETALVAHSAVYECAVVLREDRSADKRLIAYFTCNNSSSPYINELRGLLSERLPHYMIPTDFILLERLPRLPNGKLDRRALPDPETTRLGPTRTYFAPNTPTQEILIELWIRILGVQQAGIHDNFFELGGHSLLATQLISRIKGIFHVELPINTIFAAPTIAEFSKHIDNYLKLDQEITLPPITRVDRNGNSRLPLSFSQQRLWFLDQLEPDNPSYNISGAVQLIGTLDIGALICSINKIICRHEVLRTSFTNIGGQPVQIITQAIELLLPIIDLSKLAPVKREWCVERLAIEDANRPFDLTKVPLLRVKLLRLDLLEHVLLFTMHHIISDGWSLGILIQEMTTFYEAMVTKRTASLPDLPIQYADYAFWQYQCSSQNSWAVQLDYWKRQLAGNLPLLELPMARPRLPQQTFQGAALSFIIPQQLTDKLKAFNNRQGVTLFMTLLSIFKALLYRYTGQKDILIGSPIANRNHYEIEGLIGFFLNTLVLRTDLTGSLCFKELLLRVKKTALDAYAYQDLPFEKLLEQLQPERDIGRTPLFQVMFVLQNVPLPVFHLPELEITNIEIPTETVKFDLHLSFDAVSNELVGTFEYNTDLFEALAIEQMARHYQVLLSAVLTDPEQPLSSLNLLTPAECQQIAGRGNKVLPSGQFVEFVASEINQSIVKRFESQVQRYPDRIAVKTEEHAWSYDLLNRKANRIACTIATRLGTAEGRIALLFEHDAAMIAGLLAVLKAGKTYVPLDPHYPKDRLIYMLADSQSMAVLVNNNNLDFAAMLTDDQNLPLINIDEVDNSATDDNLDLDISPDRLTYILYTSGSTGQPKGVIQRDSNVLYFISAYTNNLHICPEDRLTLFSSYSFDAAVMDIFGALLNGACLFPINVKEKGLLNVANRIIDEQITIFHSTPTLYRYFINTLNGTEEFPKLRLIVLGGEEAHKNDFQFYQQHFPEECILINGLGPTESTLALQYFINKHTKIDRNSIPVGYPIVGSEVRLVNEAGEQVAIYGSGEIVISSPYLALGYWQKPQLTEAVFYTDPESNKRDYFTGDLGRWLPDGSIEFIGRKDFQVKIRGQRVEIAEIEVCLAGFPAVVETAVIARENHRGEKELVAYFTTRSECCLSELRRYLREKLPDFMIPTQYVQLDSLPLTPSGKIDRQSLPTPNWLGVIVNSVYSLSKTPIEEIIRGFFTQLLGIETIGTNDSFFDLGGHSLLATQLVSYIRTVFGIELPLRSLFDNPTIIGLVECVTTLLNTEATLSTSTIVALPRKELIPLSFAQQRLWFLDRFEPSSSTYNITVAVHLQGWLDKAALEYSINEVIKRHEALRTSFSLINDQPVQIITDRLLLEIRQQDLCHLPDEQRETIALEQAVREAKQPFNLSTGPLLRVSLFKLAEQEHILLLSMHHIISDGWSIGILIREVATFYQAYCHNRAYQLSPLPVQYADYALWQREWLQGEVLARQLAYWKKQLADIKPLSLPTDYLRPTRQSYRGAAQPIRLDRQTAEQIKALSRQEGTTLFMVLLAVFKILLQRYSGQLDIAVGTPIANRNRAEIEGLIGLFINTLVLRTDMSGSPTGLELLARVREVALGAYTHQDLPFEKLVDDLQPVRDLSRNPLFQVMFVLQNAPMPALEISGLTLKPLWIENAAIKFDLTLLLEEERQELVGEFRYNRDLFETDTITRLSSHFQTLLSSLLADPSQRICNLPLLSESERKQLLIEWNNTLVYRSQDKSVHQLFEEQSERTPDAIALICENIQLSYRELNIRANQLAYYLMKLGVTPEAPIGICLERSIEMIVALLGILKAGGTYVPLDPAYPKDRLAFILIDTQLTVLLTESRFAETLPDLSRQLICIDTDWQIIVRQATDNPALRTLTNNAAYIIYTSGSMGKPKGVIVQHHALVNYIEDAIFAYQFSPDDRILQFASINFDASAEEIYPCLSCGATLVLRNNTMLSSVLNFLQQCKEWRITVLDLPTAYWHEIVSQLANVDLKQLASLRLVILGGERALPERLAVWQQHLGKAVRLFNSYGPTEATVVATRCELFEQEEGEVPIGRPISNTRVYLLDRDLQPVPRGIIGELYIGGVGLAIGYLNQPTLSAESFIPDPFSKLPGARLYKTGDLVRYRLDGKLEFYARIDQQVKIRGFRVELGEIEAVLSEYPGVLQCLVIACEELPGDRRLAAYLVCQQTRPSTSELYSFAKQRLPDFMIPVTFFIVEKIPLTPNGKIDYRALPSFTGSRPTLTKPYVAPRTTLERYLAEQWQKVLGIDRVGIDDNFFELGGDSIRAAILINRLQTEIDKYIYIVAIFDAPTIAGLAQYLLKHYPNTICKIERAAKTCEESVEEKIDNSQVAQLRQLIRAMPVQRIEGSKNPPAIFILTAPRSGSTLLRVMLGGHPLLFAPPELELLGFNLLAERKAAFAGRHNLWLEGTIRAIMELKSCSLEQAQRLIQSYEDNRLTTREFYRLMQQWAGKRRLVDKTVSYSLDLEILKRAEAYFSEPLYIHLIRDPVGMVSSFEEYKYDVIFKYDTNFSRSELGELVWIISHQNIMAFLSDIPQQRQYQVRFEDLVSEPANVIRKLSGFLGLDFHAEMIEPYQNMGTKMTDGIHTLSKMLGDSKFHSYKKIEQTVAERSIKDKGKSFSEITWQIAEKFGYARNTKKYSNTELSAESLTPIKPVLREGRTIPLSFAQERLWLL
ncbi:MAG: amino acid adenylation domain-containing protein, partial [Acidobacteriota bacterium]